MRRGRFFFVEPSKVATQHITLIDGYLRALTSDKSSLRSMELIFCGSGSTLEHISPAIRSQVTYRSIPVMNPEKRRLALKSLIEFFVVLRYVIGMGKNDIVFVTCMLPPALMLLETANRILRRRGTYVLLHGELEGLFDESLQRISSFGYWSKKWLSIRHRRSDLKLAVIDDFIKEKLLEEFPDTLADEQIVVVHHPLAPIGNVDKVKGSRLQVCFIGYKTRFKGFDSFTRLSEANSIADFLVIGGGRVESMQDRSCRLLADTDDYLQTIGNCCAAIFPYVGGYTCSLSAAALDAISAGVHVIASERPCFMSLKKHLGAETVTICSSEDQMSEYLQDRMWLQQRRANRKVRLQQLKSSKYGIESIRQSFEKLLSSQGMPLAKLK